MNDTTARDPMTHGDRAHLFRSIARSITVDRLPGPMEVCLAPESGYVILRFDDDDVAAVQAWAARTVAGVAHGGHTYDADGARPWHAFGTREGGRQGYLLGWRVDLWSVVAGPAPAAAVPAEAGAL